MINETDLFDPFRKMKKSHRQILGLEAQPEGLAGMGEPLADFVAGGKKPMAAGKGADELAEMGKPLADFAGSGKDLPLARKGMDKLKIE